MKKKPDMMAARQLHAKVADLVSRNFDKEIKILELGSGQGAFARRIMEKGFTNLICTDVNEENFHIKEEVEFTAVNLNIDFSELFDCEFDLIVSLEVIEHLENPWHFFRQVRSLLKGNGSFIMTTPNIDSVRSRIEFLKKGRFSFYYDSDYYTGGHITPLPRFIIGYLIEKHGFSIEAYDTNAPGYNFRKPGHVIHFVMHSLIAALFVRKPQFGECHIFWLKKEKLSE